MTTQSEFPPDIEAARAGQQPKVRCRAGQSDSVESDTLASNSKQGGGDHRFYAEEIKAVDAGLLPAPGTDQAHIVLLIHVASGQRRNFHAPIDVFLVLADALARKAALLRQATAAPKN